MPPLHQARGLNARAVCPGPPALPRCDRVNHRPRAGRPAAPAPEGRKSPSDYVLASDVHWVDTYWIQIVPWGASVFGIFLVRQFFITTPQEILDAEIMTRSESVRPIEVGLARFSSANGTDYSALAAAATFTTLPLMVFFLLLQRQFIRGALSAAASIR